MNRNTPSAPRLAFVDVAKALLLYLVIVGHAVGAEDPVFRFIFAFHMHAFFFLSGFCTRRPTGNFSRYLGRKAASLLIPYVLFSLLGLGIMELFPADWKYYSDAHDYLMRYLYVAQPYALGSVWFLPCLFVASLMLFCVLRSWNGKDAWGLVAPMLFFGWLAVTLYDYIGADQYECLPFKTDSALAALPFLLLGFILREKGQVERWKTPWLLAAAGILPLIVWFAGVRHNGYVNLCGCYFGNRLPYYVASVAGCLWALVLGLLLRRVRFLAWIGRHSLPIFAIHSFFLWACQKLLLVPGSPLLSLPAFCIPFVIALPAYAASVPFGWAWARCEALLRRAWKNRAVPAKGGDPA